MLESLNSVPGVLGGMVCAPEGRVLARTFPTAFGDDTLQEAATVLADGCVGLETVTGPVAHIDLRYPEARVVVKPLQGGLLLMVCSKGVNLQLLLISIAATSKKIEKVLEEAVRAAAAAAAEPAAGEPEEAAGQQPQGKAKGKNKWWPSV